MKKGAYGIVYQEIMRSPDLPGNSKLIYAYLAAFAGNGDECYPSVETIRKELATKKQLEWQKNQVKTGPLVAEHQK